MLRLFSMALLEVLGLLLMPLLHLLLSLLVPVPLLGSLVFPLLAHFELLMFLVLLIDQLLLLLLVLLIEPRIPCIGGRHLMRLELAGMTGVGSARLLAIASLRSVRPRGRAHIVVRGVGWSVVRCPRFPGGDNVSAPEFPGA